MVRVKDAELQKLRQQVKNLENSLERTTEVNSVLKSTIARTRVIKVTEYIKHCLCTKLLMFLRKTKAAR